MSHILFLPSGTKVYYNENNDMHRLDGPAFIHHNGYKEWWKDGKFHREDGPAIIRCKYDNFSPKYEWWINDERLSEEKEKLLNIWYENKHTNYKEIK